MADGDSKKPLPPPLDSGDEALDALFGGLHDARERHAIAHPSGSLAEKVHPSRARAARAGMPIGRMVPSSDFSRRQALKAEGVPSIGLAAPRQVDQGIAPPVQQMRQMTGLAPNSRSNTYQFIPSANVDPNNTSETLAVTIPFIQFNGAVDDTDMLAIQLGIQFGSPPNNTTQDDFRIQALVKWGVGNSHYQAIVDWKNGTLITLPANYLEVSATIPSTHIATTPPILLSAGVAYGTVPAQGSRATFTTQTTNLVKAQGNTIDVDIPDWAVSFGVGPNSYDPAFVGPLLAVAGGTNKITSIAKADPDGKDLKPTTFPVPNGTVKLTLSNLDPNTNMNAIVMFGFPF